ncbi:hypothetical protein CORC01_04113 [Colletotrichum orchidophilum]|uniref:Uncharacterized protein n=1 Tax=Colletotrichum orchidophilum TaxID=1209926 RepID=A0A1G4BGR3_9PEZI|nr:uncharacterized protein CORC01_04113 [Colletotrichum orchidophilum]OHF00574.1 hypothetical protein CORC01_04113 [Colletotrichum orchidophilum]
MVAVPWAPSFIRQRITHPTDSRACSSLSPHPLLKATPTSVFDIQTSPHPILQLPAALHNPVRSLSKSSHLHLPITLSTPSLIGCFLPEPTTAAIAVSGPISRRAFPPLLLFDLLTLAATLSSSLFSAPTAAALRKKPSQHDLPVAHRDNRLLLTAAAKFAPALPLLWLSVSLRPL